MAREDVTGPIGDFLSLEGDLEGAVVVENWVATVSVQMENAYVLIVTLRHPTSEAHHVMGLRVLNV